MNAAGAAPSAQAIELRIERIPLLRWHWRMMSVLGFALCGEVIDSLGLAFALPVLMARWQLTPVEGGQLISITFIGQMLGSLLFGWLSDRMGRITILRVAMAGVALLGLAVGHAQSYGVFAALRFTQGIAMGGVLVLLYAYVVEIAGSSFRGRLNFGLNLIGTFALAAAALSASFVVMRYGPAWVFYIGAVVALPFLLLGIRLPESPRWLASKGRGDEAARILDMIEASQPFQPVALRDDHGSSPPDTGAARRGWGHLLSRDLRVPTLAGWVSAFCISSVSGMLIAWLPTIYIKSYSADPQTILVLSSLSYLGPIVATLVGMTVSDRFNRCSILMVAFGALAVLLCAMWFVLGVVPLGLVLCLSTAAVMMQTLPILMVPIIGTEQYPTPIRGAGGGAVRLWICMGAIVTPIALGFVMQTVGVPAVLLFSSAAAAVGFAAAWVWRGSLAARGG